MEQQLAYNSFAPALNSGIKSMGHHTQLETHIFKDENAVPHLPTEVTLTF